MSFDLSVFRSIHLGWKSPVGDYLFAFLSYSGLGFSVAMLAFGLALKKSTRHFTGPILLSIILGGTVFAQSLKSVMPRPRPSQLSWALAQEPHQFSSFPSAHTACAFSAATIILILSYRNEKPVLGWISMLWACGVGLSRIYRGVHWPTDVLGGAMLGILAGCIIGLIFRPKSD
jgi:undecaprenyl-diphosphatase